MSVGEILDSLGQSRLMVVETGNKCTREIAQWIAKHPESKFTNVDLDGIAQFDTHQELEQDGTARYCTFLTQDHFKHLSGRTWVDVCVLHAPDLQTGLTEFLLSVSTGAKIIVMTDYQSRAALAIRRAKQIGWTYEAVGDLNVLRRPQE